MKFSKRKNRNTQQTVRKGELLRRKSKLFNTILQLQKKLPLFLKVYIILLFLYFIFAAIALPLSLYNETLSGFINIATVGIHTVSIIILIYVKDFISKNTWNSMYPEIKFIWWFAFIFNITLGVRAFFVQFL